MQLANDRASFEQAHLADIGDSDAMLRRFADESFISKRCGKRSAGTHC